MKNTDATSEREITITSKVRTGRRGKGREERVDDGRIRAVWEEVWQPAKHATPTLNYTR